MKITLYYLGIQRYVVEGWRHAWFFFTWRRVESNQGKRQGLQLCKFIFHKLRKWSWIFIILLSCLFICQKYFIIKRKGKRMERSYWVPGSLPVGKWRSRITKLFCSIKDPGPWLKRREFKAIKGKTTTILYSNQPPIKIN